MESDVTHIHEHSVYTHCLNCKSWGINLPSETRCGNCSAEAGVLYVPQCCVRAAHAEGRKAAENDIKQEMLKIADSLHEGIDCNSTLTQDFSAWKNARGLV